ncbi:hypothetical protein CC80DRAFT_494887 [Byssothecium circinans]|uniref:Uncharacterized protein n=1 Tax=Byssothecium circinans TaxID=147558 RepID=A0A6A5TMP2_9PLEO|nr:hypothetical protein CC80DRAFT_494887 [Byssothecium circinans]
MSSNTPATTQDAKAVQLLAQSSSSQPAAAAMDPSAPKSTAAATPASAPLQPAAASSLLAPNPPATPQKTPELGASTATQPATPGASQFANTPRSIGRLRTPRKDACTEDLSNYETIVVHTAKCSVCDQRNKTSHMLRCKGCNWEICKPCQDKREAKKAMVIAHGKVGATTPGSRNRYMGTPRAPPASTTPIPMKPLTPAAGKKFEKAQEESKGDGTVGKTPAKKLEKIPEEATEVKTPAKKKTEQSKMATAPHAQAATPPNSGGKRKRTQTPRAAKVKGKGKGKGKTNLFESDDDEEDELSDVPESPDTPPVERQKTPKGTAPSRKSRPSMPPPAFAPASAPAPASRASRRTFAQDQPAERTTTSPTPKNPKPITSTGVSYHNNEAAARATFGDDLMNQMSGYTQGGHLLGRQMPPVNSEAAPAPLLNPDITVKEYVFADVEARHKIRLDAETKGALLGAIRFRFRAFERPGVKAPDVAMQALSKFQRLEIDRMLHDDSHKYLP